MWAGSKPSTIPKTLNRALNCHSEVPAPHVYFASFLPSGDGVSRLKYFGFRVEGFIGV